MTASKPVQNRCSRDFSRGSLGLRKHPCFLGTPNKMARSDYRYRAIVHLGYPVSSSLLPAFLNRIRVQEYMYPKTIERCSWRTSLHVIDHGSMIIVSIRYFCAKGRTTNRTFVSGIPVLLQLKDRDSRAMIARCNGLAVSLCQGNFA